MLNQNRLGNISRFLFVSLILLSTSISSSQTAYEINISYVNLSGQSVGFSNFEGKYIVLDIFAEWCAPCRAQMLYLHDVYSVISNEPSVDLFSLDGSPETDNIQVVKGFKEQYSAPWDFGLDVNATFRNTFTDGLFPTTMILSPSGAILKKWVGATDSKTILKELDKHVKLDGWLGRAIDVKELINNLINSPAFFIFLIMMWVFIYITGLKIIRKLRVDPEQENTTNLSSEET